MSLGALLSAKPAAARHGSLTRLEARASGVSRLQHVCAARCSHSLAYLCPMGMRTASSIMAMKAKLGSKAAWPQLPHSGARRDRGAGGAGRMRALLAYMRSTAPGMHIVILGILPRGAWSLPSQFAWPNRLTRTLAAINAASEVRGPHAHGAAREPQSAQSAGGGVQGAAGGSPLCPVAEGARTCSPVCWGLQTS